MVFEVIKPISACCATCQRSLPNPGTSASMLPEASTMISMFVGVLIKLASSDGLIITVPGTSGPVGATVTVSVCAGSDATVGSGVVVGGVSVGSTGGLALAVGGVK